MGVDPVADPARTIIVEPIESPNRPPAPEPVPERAPVAPVEEPVPA